MSKTSVVFQKFSRYEQSAFSYFASLIDCTIINQSLFESGKTAHRMKGTEKE